MAHNGSPSFLTLPIELIYRILDQLQPYDILVSVRNVCSRLDQTMDTYHRYQVTLAFSYPYIEGKGVGVSMRSGQ